jgi:hypothetical protein
MSGGRGQIVPFLLEKPITFWMPGAIASGILCRFHIVQH